MPRTSRGRRAPTLPVATALAAGLLLSCEARDDSPPVAVFEMVDLPAPAMFLELAQHLEMPYLLELPEVPVHERHDLSLSETTAAGVLEELHRLDPRYHYEVRPGLLVCWAGEELVPDNPLTGRLPEFRVAGGAAQVVKELVAASGLGDTMDFSYGAAGARRPVRVDVRDASVRDVLAEVAVQARVSFKISPYRIRMYPVEPPLPPG